MPDRKKRIICKWLHRGWGNNIEIMSWFDESKNKLARVCLIMGDIQEGDELWMEMQSRKIGKFKLVNVKRMHDPGDQHFADLEHIDYATETKEEAEKLDQGTKRYLFSSR